MGLHAKNIIPKVGKTKVPVKAAKKSEPFILIERSPEELKKDRSSAYAYFA